MEDAGHEITSFIGEEVYVENGDYLGEVEDLVLGLDTDFITHLAGHCLDERLCSVNYRNLISADQQFR